MEIQYKNTREDYEAFFELLWSKQKAAQCSVYYHTVLWYLTILGLASYIAIKHEEVFAVCVFAALAIFYLKQNWSFAKNWDERVQAAADMNPENSATLVLDDTGAAERVSGTQCYVPWTEMHGYTTQDNRLFIHYLKHRCFIIPFRDLSGGQRNELVETLERHKVRKKT